jgi:hypothetical protein
MRNAIRRPASDGTVSDPTVNVICASSVAITALDTDNPTERINELSPFADAVSCTGTDPMISPGIAA